MTAELFIIGAGPAGISAAIEAARLGISTAVIEKNRVGGTVWCARRIDNFPPLSSISGKALGTMFQKRFDRAGIEPIPGEVKEIAAGIESGFDLMTGAGQKLEARAVLLAIGQVNRIPEELVPFGGHIGSPGGMYPSGGNEVVVYGGGDAAFDQALLFSDKKCGVRIFCRSVPKAKAALLREARLRGIPVNEGFVLESAAKSGAATEASFRGPDGNRTVVSCSCLLAALGKTAPDLKICGRFLPDLLKEGVRESGELAVRGVFAAGDVRRGRARNVAAAVSDGIMSANGALAYLKGVRNGFMGDR